MPKFNQFMPNAQNAPNSIRNGLTMKPNQMMGGVVAHPRPLFNVNQQQPPPPYLLNQINQKHFVFAKFEGTQISNLNKSLNATTLQIHQQSKLQFTHFPTIHHHNNNQIIHKPKEQLIHQHIPPRMSCVINENVKSRAEKSDPENHIYEEVIDEYEVNRSILKAPNPVNADETNNSNLFQNLLRAEMISQMKSCSKIGNNGYLSHLPQQKRMDIIQETALSLASAAYLEKFVYIHSLIYHMTRRCFRNFGATVKIPSINENFGEFQEF